MQESLETDAKALILYRERLKCAEGRSVILEDYARADGLCHASARQRDRQNGPQGG